METAETVTPGTGLFGSDGREVMNGGWRETGGVETETGVTETVEVADGPTVGPGGPTGVSASDGNMRGGGPARLERTDGRTDRG